MITLAKNNNTIIATKQFHNNWEWTMDIIQISPVNEISVFMAAAQRAQVVIMSKCLYVYICLYVFVFVFLVTFSRPLIGQKREGYIVEEVI